uniref:Keratin 18a, tandem duplicate 1 n=1 Tax=Takifugu rubripes TaxID=31033 RepID=H2UHD5_TAKRU
MYLKVLNSIVPLSLFLPLSVTSRVSTATMKSTYSVYSSSASSRAPTASMMRASTGPVYRAATVHGGAASGSRISLSSASTLRYDSGMTLAIGNEKTTMQHLNDRLASYLETVRNLEKANAQLEIKIREYVDSKGPLEGRDYSKYFAIIEDLRAKVCIKNAFLKVYCIICEFSDISTACQQDPGYPATFLMEYEMSMRKTVEADVARLRKVLDDTNIIRLHVESDIESLKEELITLKKNHDTVRGKNSY